MSFFKSFTKSIVGAVTNPAKFATAVTTGGASLFAPKLFAPLTNTLNQTLYNPKLIAPALGLVTGNPSLAIGAFPAPPNSTGGSPMAFNVGQFLGNVGNAFSGSTNPYFSGIGNIAGLASNFAQPVAQRMPMPSGGLPAVRSPMGGIAGRVGGAVGRGFFNKFPNLATSIQGFRNVGKKVTRQQLWNLLKRFGPDILITGGILSAASISELMTAGPGSRRMNVGNIKALRRCHRRMVSFHKVCRTNDVLLHARKTSKKSSGRSQPQQFIRQG